jgi:lipopolysaccharide heptosyltransferase II
MQLKGFSKILIVRLSSLGDILLATPFIRSIKKNYPEIKIDFLLKEQYKDILINNPYLNELILYRNDDSVKKEIAAKNYEIIIDLQNNFRSKKIISEAKMSILKFNKKSLDKFLLVNFKINRLKDSPPIPVRYAETLSDFSLDNEGLDLFSNNLPSEKIKNKNDLVGFCPGARHFTKIWPSNNYIELGNMLAEAGYDIVLFGGKNDKEICKEISSKISSSIDLSGDDDLLQIAADMKLCKFIVCNDSGLMHAACAVGIPVMVFFGSTVKEFGFAPYRNKNLIMENNFLPCRPCSHIGRASCPKGHFKCMLELTPHLAFNQLILFLKS